MENILQVRELTVQYRSVRGMAHLAVDRISFDIASAEIVGLMGESGCGKTSIALTLLGLLPKVNANVTGLISFRGEDLLAMDERSLQRIRGAEISMVSQEPGISLSPVLRVVKRLRGFFRRTRTS